MAAISECRYRWLRVPDLQGGAAVRGADGFQDARVQVKISFRIRTAGDSASGAASALQLKRLLSESWRRCCLSLLI
jgi:hypothetical protein